MCYAAVGVQFNDEFDPISSHGANIFDDEYIFEQLECKFHTQCARHWATTKDRNRMQSLLSEDVVKDKSLVCTFVVALIPPCSE